MPGIHTIGNGSCAYNGFALGLADALLRGDSFLIFNRAADEIFAEFPKFSGNRQDKFMALKDWLAQATNTEIQNKLAPALRRIVIKQLKENKFYQEQLFNNFKRAYDAFLIDEADAAAYEFTQLPQVKALFIEMKQQPLDTVEDNKDFEVHWGDVHSGVMADYLKAAEASTFWAGSFELQILAKDFGLPLMCDKAGYIQKEAFDGSKLISTQGLSKPLVKNLTRVSLQTGGFIAEPVLGGEFLSILPEALRKPTTALAAIEGHIQAEVREQRTVPPDLMEKFNTALSVPVTPPLTVQLGHGHWTYQAMPDSPIAQKQRALSISRTTPAFSLEKAKRWADHEEAYNSLRKQDIAPESSSDDLDTDGVKIVRTEKLTKDDEEQIAQDAKLARALQAELFALDDKAGKEDERSAFNRAKHHTRPR